MLCDLCDITPHLLFKFKIKKKKLKNKIKKNKNKRKIKSSLLFTTLTLLA